MCYIISLIIHWNGEGWAISGIIICSQFFADGVFLFLFYYKMSSRFLCNATCLHNSLYCDTVLANLWHFCLEQEINKNILKRKEKNSPSL